MTNPDLAAAVEHLTKLADTIEASLGSSPDATPLVGETIATLRMLIENLTGARWDLRTDPWGPGRRRIVTPWKENLS